MTAFTCLQFGDIHKKALDGSRLVPAGLTATNHYQTAACNTGRSTNIIKLKKIK